ncbi:SIR2 family protein [Bacillus atrophaeus]|jgi:hypothetical protein|uniref:SIR2 family protein n=1 Tax=Bacillus subtilis group TaxID=653685 RepID=UPI000FC2E287|nr:MULTISPECIES: SIR2 family protein [Bacillus subtilis group]MCY8633482.1 SIR2 family protein [Bacillus spizizenii]MCY8765666.1 SIR2 family protein [Bacillus spizizenii]MCY8804117.1 SIR2 family protein [Bacillus spizizenii]MEC1268358.1 SIR2 family protein [Bacillus vallismortis]MED4804292.1 SIR2 family protein [Bacillus atrophaeus]
MSFANLVEGKKLPVLFVGSGFSRRYLNAPNWEELLVQIYEFIGKSKQDYKKLKSRIRNDPSNSDLRDGELNASIAEHIEKEFNIFFYDSKLIDQYPDWIDGNPFRECISLILNRLSILENKKTELQVFKSLKNKVISIITTNYDRLLEELFTLEKEDTFIGQPELFNPNSLGVGELYKLHGCVSDSQNIVITKKDYDNFKDNAKLFSAKLLTLISENPVVFIGYSINDPNVQQTLSDLVRCLSSEQVSELKNHFYVIDYCKGEEDIIEKEILFNSISYTGQVATFPVTVISTDNYKLIYEKLSKLTPAMNLTMVKQVKRIVKDIVIESTEANKNPDKTIAVLLDDVNQLTNPQQKLAIAIGKISDIKTYGYNIMNVEEILEDIIWENKDFDSKKLITTTYEGSFLKSYGLLPIYKYLCDIEQKELIRLTRVMNHIEKHQKKEDFLNSNFKKQIKSFPESNDISNIPDRIKVNSRNKYLWIIKNIENFNMNDLNNFLKEEFAEYIGFDSIRKSDFRRLVSVYDFYKYKKSY